MVEPGANVSSAVDSVVCQPVQQSVVHNIQVIDTDAFADRASEAETHALTHSTIGLIQK